MPLLIANIGDRDLRFDGKECRPARAEGERLLEKYDELNGRLSFPIFGKALEHVEKNRGARPGTISIHLFVTDQSDPDYRDSDTIAFGRIIKKHFGNNRRINLCVIRQEPNFYDSMFVFYQTQLAGIAKKSVDMKVDMETVYVLATAGAPACNMALLFHAITRFGSAVVPLYVKKDAPVIEMQSTEQLMESFARRSVFNHIGSYDYAAAIGIGLMQENVKRLAEAAQARLNFDFKTAYDGLRAVRGNVPGSTARLVSIENHIAKIIEKEDRMALLRELALNIDIKYKARQYADLLGRLFRFEEALLQNAVVAHGGIAIDAKSDRDWLKFNASIRACDGLEEFLKTVKAGKEPLKYKEPTRIVLRKIVEYLIKNVKDEHGTLSRMVECADAITEFSDLRNKSVIAHGFQGISGNDLNGRGIEAVLRRIDSIVEDPADISFDRINECIKELIDPGSV